MTQEEAPHCTLKEFAELANDTSNMQAWERTLRNQKLNAAGRLTTAKEARMFAAYSVFNIRKRVNELMRELTFKGMFPTQRDQFEYCFAFADVAPRDAIVDRYRDRYAELLEVGLIHAPEPNGMDLNSAIFLADAQVLSRETLDVYDIGAMQKYKDILDDLYPFTETFKAYDLNIDPLPAVIA